MKSVLHWPKHFFLVAAETAGHTDQAHPMRHMRADRHNMGSKAYNLLRMANIGLPVPPALVLGTHYTQAPDECILPLFSVGLPALQEKTGYIFGDARKPLIVSVRSGAPVSMPGMMETLLNIGLCEKTLPGLLRLTGNPRLVWDAYRRLIASYGEVVHDLPAALFETEIAQLTQGRDERQLDFNELRTLTRRFLECYAEHAGAPFPQDCHEQLTGAVCAVFASWQSEKAQTYRRLNHIDADIGTAVTIQSMVFGNTGSHSGAGVGFTRDPSSGEPQLWLDFLVNAQGEDVVSGRRNAHGHQALASVAPEAWRKLEESARAIEQEFTDMQDFEFTVQDGTLYMLQTRSGKRTPLAAARIALDLLAVGLIDTHTAQQRTADIQEQDIGTIRLVTQSEGQAAQPLAQATSACQGVVHGEIALDAERAATRVSAGVNIILVRQDAETSDIAALESAMGLLTQRGARTSHAAVVARQLGKVCLVGCSNLQIDITARTIFLGDVVLHEGEIITLDGNTGAIYSGAIEAVLVPDTNLLERLRALRAAQTDMDADTASHLSAQQPLERRQLA